MEAKTGRVVAMASNPDYDPNAWVGGISAKDYAKLTGKKSNYPLLNRAIQGQSAPGSVFKVIPTAAAVNAGYSFDGPYQCSSSYSIGGQVFKNFESQSHGAISLGKALEVSCDTVFYRLSHEEWKRDGGIKPKKGANDWFYKTAHQFGLGAETGIDLPNEVTGRIPDRQWKQKYWEDNKDAWCKYGKKGGSYAEQIAYENCSKATACVPVTPSTTPSARATPSSPPSRWPPSTRPSPTAAPSTTPPSARRSSVPTARTCRRSHPSRTASCR